MAIARLRIRNYRSIQNLDLTLSPINAFIGPNNSGKSNILRALNLLLGEVYPTVRSFTDKDFHGHNANNPIEITALFQNPLVCDSDVAGFCLRCDQQGVDYFPVDVQGQPCVWRPYNRPKKVSNEMRDEVALLYLDLERQAEKQLRVTQWTLYGKLLKQIEAAIGAGQKQQFTADVRQAVDTHIRASLNQAQQILNDFVQRQTGLTVRLDFRILDPLQVLRGVRPFVIDAAMDFDPEDVGAGVQSALAVAIAKAYAEIVRNPLVLAIEEPELYLHPHGCRHFYKLLQELAGQGVQIVYATHERSFVSAGEFDSIHIVRRPAAATQVNSGNTLGLAGIRDRLRLQSRFNERVNEVFFASCVVLVEADPDEIACRCALEAQQIELDKKSISVVPASGKDEIPIIAQLLAGLHIPTLALLDEDPGNQSTAQTVTRIQQVLGAPNVFLQSPNLEGLFGLARKPTRVEAMTHFPQHFANAANPMPPVYTQMAARINQIVP
jgi:predicted ATP-dependent endonuclease of OLD family